MHDDLAKIPGYLAAVKRENDVRDAAFLALPARICAITVQPMTLRHWILLDAIDSPFLRATSAPPAPDDIIRLLWILSPQFNAIAAARWDKLLACANRVFFVRIAVRWIVSFISARGRFCARASRIPYGQAVIAIKRYIDDTFQDSPPSGESDGSPPQISFAANLIWTVNAKLHFPRQTVLRIPLRELFQYLKLDRMCSAAARGEKFSGWNPSDQIKTAYIRELRRQRKVFRESQAAGQPPETVRDQLIRKSPSAEGGAA